MWLNLFASMFGRDCITPTTYLLGETWLTHVVRRNYVVRSLCFIGGTGIRRSCCFPSYFMKVPIFRILKISNSGILSPLKIQNSNWWKSTNVAFLTCFKYLFHWENLVIRWFPLLKSRLVFTDYAPWEKPQFFVSLMTATSNPYVQCASINYACEKLGGL